MVRKARYVCMALLFITGFGVVLGASAHAQQGEILASPPLTVVTALLPPTPTPTPPPSDWARKALEYISEHYDVPLGNLLVVNEHERSYPLTDRIFQAFTLLDTRPSPKILEYSLLIDKETGQVEEDIAAVQAAEDDAYRARYGKLHPALYERLHEIEEDDTLPVAIWVAPDPRSRTLEQVYDELATRYPEAAQALEQRKAPWEVDDLALVEEIREAYRQMRVEDTMIRVKSLTDDLTEHHLQARTYGAMPSVSALLTKSMILELAERDDIGLMYLVEEPYSADMNVSASTDRVPAVWRRGIDGTGVRVAILEDYNIASNCLDVMASIPGTQGLPPNTEHMTAVANIVACDADPYRGIAYGARIIGAGFDSSSWPAPASQESAVQALQWAIQYPQSANVVNLSAGWEADNNMNWTDRAFDYWARAEKVTIVKSAGNTGAGSGSIKSPGKAWNVITVGGINDDNDADWANDEIASSSSYVNPSVGVDREKPEVVAPGVSIRTLRRDGTPDDFNGTSFAAPQVSGLAALLIDRSASVVWYPNAIKSIIMASAVHNVHGPRDIPKPADPNYPDLKDGAGSIDAALADKTAQVRAYQYDMCSDPCWWHDDEFAIPPTGFWYSRYFYASKGEKIRVAISWYSNADPPNPAPIPSEDVLDNNFNLSVYSLADLPQLVASSASWSNNYELVEFTAPDSGQYEIRVSRGSDSCEENCYNSVGIAWTKQAIYLPDVKSGYNGWDSDIVIRNDGAQPRDVTVTLFHPTGVWASKATYYGLPSRAVWSYDPSNTGFYGSAIVDGSEDVSVAVVNDNGSEAYAYVGIPHPSSVSGVGAGNELFIPSYLRDFYGYSSTVYVQNVGGEATTVYAWFYGDDGTLQSPYQQITIAPHQRTEFHPLSSYVNVGSIHLTADQPIAATVVYDHPSDDTMAYSALTSPGDHGYLPVLFKDYYGWYSSYQTQEAAGSTANVSVDYCLAGAKFYSLNPRGQRNVWMGGEPMSAPWSGSAVVSVSSGQKVATAATHGGPGGSQGYHGPKQGMRDLVLPTIKKGVDGWDSSITVQNVGQVNSLVTAHFYDSGGTQIGPPFPFTVSAGCASMLYSQMPTGTSSVWLHSDSADIVAVTNHGHTNQYSMGYSVP